MFIIGFHGPMENKPNPHTEKLYRSIQLTRPLLRHISAYVEQELGDSSVTVGQRAVLEVLYTDGAMTAPQLTQKLELKRQFVGRMLAEATDAGLVTQQANPEHARAHFHVLTDAGHGAIARIREHEMQKLSELEALFTVEEIDTHFRIQAAMNRWFADRLTANRAKTTN